jgi:hypothetical protein
MVCLKHPGRYLAAVLLAIMVIATPGSALDLPGPVCDVLIHENLVELEDARIAVDLARSNYAAYEKIFAMIEELWAAGTIPRMEFLRAKYDRDAADLGLEEADLILQRQDALVEQYRIVCGESAFRIGTSEQANAIREAYLRYRRADCASLAKKIEIAGTRLEFSNEFLQRTLQLRRERFATNTQVILAELDVEREEKSLADARRRTAVCRAGLDKLEDDVDTASLQRSP